MGTQLDMHFMRIADTDAKSYRKKEIGKVLSQHEEEKEKKYKYLQTCLEMQRAFTPMVYLVDGIAGREARNAEKRLATYLAASKWTRRYSQMVYYVRVRMAIAAVRANSLLIHGGAGTDSAPDALSYLTELPWATGRPGRTTNLSPSSDSPLGLAPLPITADPTLSLGAADAREPRDAGLAQKIARP